MNPPNRYSAQKQHNRYGIKNWLLNNGFEEPVHKKTILDFCEHKKPGFKTKNKNSPYNFVQKHFSEFCKWAIDKLKG